MFKVRIDNGRGDLVNWTTTRTIEEANSVRNQLHEDHDFYLDDIFIDEI